MGSFCFQSARLADAWGNLVKIQKLNQTLRYSFSG